MSQGQGGVGAGGGSSWPPGGGGGSGAIPAPTLPELAQQLIENDRQFLLAKEEYKEASKKVEEAQNLKTAAATNVDKISLARNKLLKQLQRFQLTEYEGDDK